MCSIKVRHGEINSRKIAVFDDLVSLSVIEEEFKTLNSSSFTHTEYATVGTERFRHWVRPIPVKFCVAGPLWPPSRKATSDIFGAKSIEPLRSYTNFASYGDMLFSHTDSAPSRSEVTALWYICPRWETDWGGETLFFDDGGDAAFVTSPRPGRLVVFDGRILHVGTPPSRICELPRYTFAIKMRIGF
jgi:hypothetical protein